MDHVIIKLFILTLGCPYLRFCMFLCVFAKMFILDKVVLPIRAYSDVSVDG